MSQVLNYHLELFGPRRGQTIVINGHQFIKGVCAEVIHTNAAASFLSVMAFYGAYAKGTLEFEAATEKLNAAAPQAEKEVEEKEVEETTDGANEVHTNAGSGSPDGIQDGSGPAGAGPSTLSSDELGGADNTETGNAGSGATGSGPENAGVTKFEDVSSQPVPSEPGSVGNEDIKAAILKLDPENDDHWAKRGAAVGKPLLGAVADAYGRADLTRDDLEAALPGYNRDKAREAVVAI